MNAASPSFVDLLRVRRALAPEDIVLLLAGWVEEVDQLDDPGVSDWLGLLRIRWTGEPGDLAAPINTWPAYRLTLENDDADDDVTCLQVQTLLAEAFAQPSVRLARLLCELLGGGRRDGAGQLAFSPIAGLGEAPDEVLRRGMEGDCEEPSALWREWLRALDLKPGAGWVWRAPRWLQDRSQPGAVLELTPLSGSHPPVRLVGRPVFRIGRSRKLNDWPARVEVQGQLNSDASKLISRVHVLGEWTADGPAFRDGNGDAPSANGSRLNRQRLPADAPRLLPAEAVLQLGGVYRLQVMHLAEAGFPGYFGPAAPGSAASPGGAMIFLPLDGRDVVREAVWLRGEIGFVISRTGRLVWNRGSEGQSGGFFLVRDGQFWLANFSLSDGQLRVDDAVLAAGELAPLVSGQILELGPLRFRVEVS